MPDNSNSSGSPLTRKKYMPAFKAYYVRLVVAEARQIDVASAQSLSLILLGRWQREALAEVVPNSAECDEIERVEQESAMLVVTSVCFLAQAIQTAAIMSRY